MWRCSQFYFLHRWSRSSWYRLLGHLFWSNRHHDELSPPSPTTTLTGTSRCSLWSCFRHWASVGRSLYYKSVLEMVLLHQSSCWRRCYNRSYVDPPYPKGKESWHALETASSSARSYRNRLLRLGYSLSSTSSAVGRINLRLGQWTHHCSTGSLCPLHLCLHRRTNLEARDRNCASTHLHTTKYSGWYVVAILYGLGNDDPGLLHSDLVPGYQGCQRHQIRHRHSPYDPLPRHCGRHLWHLSQPNWILRSIHDC